ncbi:MAG: hypothetical protein J6U64_00040 [Alphaproteobacteria bacterium]|jgi:hypothetical protein|nr:hypothetical protein [Alphaproteobacteria bacterium]
MLSRYVFYKDDKGRKILTVWGSPQSHEDYMKKHNILQTETRTKWEDVVSMGYLRLDLDEEKLYVAPLLNKDERYVSHYLQQIKNALEHQYPETPRMQEAVQLDASDIIPKMNRMPILKGYER